MRLKGQVADLNDAIKRVSSLYTSSEIAAGGASRLAFTLDRTHNLKVPPSKPGSAMSLKSG